MIEEVVEDQFFNCVVEVSEVHNHASCYSLTMFGRYYMSRTVDMVHLASTPLITQNILTSKNQNLRENGARALRAVLSRSPSGTAILP